MHIFSAIIIVVPLIAPLGPEYVTIASTGKAACWALVNLIVLSVKFTIPVPDTSSSLPSNVIGAGAAKVITGIP